MRCLWDTDVVSEYLRGKNPHVLQKAIAYLSQYTRPAFSLITSFEVLRGLKAKKATRLLKQFEAVSQNADIYPLTPDVIVLAADIWAALKQSGQLIGDNDILIASTALHNGLGVATGNVAHFSRIPGLTVEDWFNP